MVTEYFIPPVDTLHQNAQRLMNILSDGKPLPNMSVVIQGQVNIDLKSKNKNYRLTINFNDKATLKNDLITITEETRLQRYTLNNRDLSPEFSAINLDKLVDRTKCNSNEEKEHKVRFSIPEHISSFAHNLDKFFEKIRVVICNEKARNDLISTVYSIYNRILPSGEIHVNTQKNDPLRIIITDNSGSQEVVNMEMNIDELFTHEDGNINITFANTVTTVNGEECSAVAEGESLHIKSLLQNINNMIKNFRHKFCNNNDVNTGEAVDGTPSAQILTLLSQYIDIIRKVDEEMVNEPTEDDDLAGDNLVGDPLSKTTLTGESEPQVNVNILEQPTISLPTTRQLLYQRDDRVYLILKIVLFICLLYTAAAPESQKSLAKLLKADKDLVMLLTIVLYIAVCALIYIYL